MEPTTVAEIDLKLNAGAVDVAVDPNADVAPKAETAVEPNAPNPPSVADEAGMVVEVGKTADDPKTDVAPNADTVVEPNAPNPPVVVDEAGTGGAVGATEKGELPNAGAPNAAGAPNVEEPKAGAPNGLDEGATAEGIENAGAPKGPVEMVAEGFEKAEKAEGAARVEDGPKVAVEPGTGVDAIVGKMVTFSSS